MRTYKVPPDELIAVDVLEEWRAIDDLSMAAHPEKWDAKLIFTNNIEKLERGAKDSEMSLLCHALLSKLSPRERKAIDMIFFEEQTARAAAGCLGISVNGLAEIITDALVKMRGFKEEGDVKSTPCSLKPPIEII